VLFGASRMNPPTPVAPDSSVAGLPELVPPSIVTGSTIPGSGVARLMWWIENWIVSLVPGVLFDEVIAW